MGIDLKDLVGLGDLGKKLLDVLSQGFGAIFKPSLTRRNADAIAYLVETISDAGAKAQESGFSTVYKDGSLTIAPMYGENTEIGELAQRAYIRQQSQELRRQINLEQISSYAADELQLEAGASPDPVDPDWVTRFFNYAQDVSSEQMQRIWGKILAGEVSKPGSFSFRTLDTLRSVSASEARAFAQIANYIIIDEKAFQGSLPWVGLEDYFEGKAGITFGQILLLQQSGFLGNYASIQFESASETIIVGGRTFSIELGERKRSFDIAFSVTQCGMELLSLIQTISDAKYIYRILKHLSQGQQRIYEIDQADPSVRREITVEEIEAALAE